MSSFQDLPFLPSPPGQMSNFENPSTQALVIILVCSLCLALMWPLFLLTMYSKAWVTRALGWEDGMSAPFWHGSS